MNASTKTTQAGIELPPEMMATFQETLAAAASQAARLAVESSIPGIVKAAQEAAEASAKAATKETLGAALARRETISKVESGAKLGFYALGTAFFLTSIGLSGYGIFKKPGNKTDPAMGGEIAAM